MQQSLILLFKVCYENPWNNVLILQFSFCLRHLFFFFRLCFYPVFVYENITKGNICISMNWDTPSTSRSSKSIKSVSCCHDSIEVISMFEILTLTVKWELNINVDNYLYNICDPINSIYLQKSVVVRIILLNSSMRTFLGHYGICTYDISNFQ